MSDPPTPVQERTKLIVLQQNENNKDYQLVVVVVDIVIT